MEETNKANSDLNIPKVKIEKFSVSKRLKSFQYAWSGIKLLFQSEHNARIHLLASVLIVSLGFFLQISALEWIAVLFCIGIVFAFEALNTAIEYLADYLAPEKHENIRKTKDLAAGAVLISAIVSAIIGGIIFIPKVMLLFGSGAKF